MNSKLLQFLSAHRRTRIDFSSINFIICVLIIIANPVIQGTMSIIQLTGLILIGYIFISIGILLLKSLGLKTDNNSIYFYFLAFFIVSTLMYPMLGLLLYWLDFGIIFLILALVSIAISFKFSYHSKVDIIGSLHVFLCFVLFVLVKSDLEFTVASSTGLMDATYFTSVMASLSQQPYLETLNEIKSPIGYQIFSFLGAVPIKWLTGVSSHIALWNIWMPFGMILFFAGLLEFIRTYLFSNTINSRWLLIIPFLFIGLFPLHFLNIWRLDWFNWYLPGLGGLLPGGNPPFSFSLSIILFVLIWLYQNIEGLGKTKNILILGILTGCSIGFKVATFPVLASFVVIYFILTSRSIQKTAALIIVTFFSAITCYLICFGTNGSTSTELSFGYFVQHHGGDLTLNSWVKSLGLISVLLFFRVAIISVTWKKNWIFYVAALSALVISFGFPFFLKIRVLSDDGLTILRDISFDLLQFTRQGIWFISLAALLAAFSLLSYAKKNVLKIIVTGHCVFVFTSWLIAPQVITKSSHVDYLNWKGVVENELDKNKEVLFACFPNEQYISQGLTADDYGPFYATSNASVGGLATSTRNDYRWGYMEKVYNALVMNDSLAYNEALILLKKEKVDGIIINPEILGKSSLAKQLQEDYIIKF
jgi:hypothetical protein